LRRWAFDVYRRRFILPRIEEGSHLAKAAPKKAPTEQLPKPVEPKRFKANREELLRLYREMASFMALA